jgi:hypothetical protein
MSGRRAGGLGALLVLALAARAQANGAFPDALSILLPVGSPQKITLATNFGLVASDDGGRSWEWTCEHDAALGAIFYQLGPPPQEVTYALGLSLVHTTDDGCTWQAATGRAAGGFLYDVFADSTNPRRVLALADPNDETPARTRVFESQDGGATFPNILYTADPGVDLSGVESAASEPDTLYIPWVSSVTGGVHTGVIRVRGGTAERFDYGAVLGDSLLRLAAVDRQDPRKLYLRVLGDVNDRLAISEDGGATVRVALELAGVWAGMVLRPDGTLLAASRDLAGGTLFVSRDGGRSFPTRLPGPRFRALGERAGRLYAAADDAVDGYALGTSDDQGQTWKPLLRFSDVARVKSCPGRALAATCAGSCQSLLAAQTLRREVCAQPPADAGPFIDAQSPPPPPADGGVAMPVPSGCQCGLGAGGPGSPWLIALAWLSLRCRRRRSPACPRSSAGSPPCATRRSRRWPSRRPRSRPGWRTTSSARRTGTRRWHRSP